MADQPKLSPRRKRAIKKLQRVEDGALTLQASLAGFISDVRDVREMLQGDPAPDPKGPDAPDQ